MNELVLTDYVRKSGDEVVTTSRLVANKFSRRHADVLATIRKLEVKINERYFSPVTYIDEKGEARIEFEMDLKGYLLLSMRFSGDEAVRVQKAFVEAFVAMKEHIEKDLKIDQKYFEIYPAVAPTFSSLYSVAQLFLDDKNQALLYANKATRRETGVDFQSILQIELKNADQSRAFTPTELGQRIGLSAVKFNRALEDGGFQEKKNSAWCATEKGKPHSVLLDAGKKHSDGTPIQQLKWLESVLQLIGPAQVA